MWDPIESNPEVMNKFLTRLGVPRKWQVVDVLSLDEQLLGIIPQPTLAMILLFPTSDKYEQFKKKQEDNLREKGQEVSKEVYYLKQTISNSCGTVALIHSVANNLDSIQLGDGFLKQFIEDSKSMTPDERGAALASNEGFAAAHAEIAAEGQSQLPADNNPVVHHFVSFVCKNETLYELDGRKAFPINHGPSSPKTFLRDAAKVIVGIMNADPDELRFVVCALAANVED